MPTLDNIRSDIARRLDELKDVVAEHAQLKALHDQWEDLVGPAKRGPGRPRSTNGRRGRPPKSTVTTPAPARVRANASATQAAPAEVASAPEVVKRGRKPASAKRSLKRAPRGQNRSKVLAALAGSPDGAPLSAGEVASATGIGNAIVYAVLTELVKSGAAKKHGAGRGGVTFTAGDVAESKSTPASTS